MVIFFTFVVKILRAFLHICSWPFLHLSLIFTYVGGFTSVGTFTFDGLTLTFDPVR